MIIVMPVEENKGIDSKIFNHFGQTPFWAVFDTGSQDLKIHKKSSRHGSGGCSAVDEVMQYNPDIVYVLDMGIGAIKKCTNCGVKVKSGNFSTIKEAIDHLDDLQDIQRGCER